MFALFWPMFALLLKYTLMLHKNCNNDNEVLSHKLLPFTIMQNHILLNMNLHVNGVKILVKLSWNDYTNMKIL